MHLSQTLTFLITEFWIAKLRAHEDKEGPLGGLLFPLR